MAPVAILAALAMAAPAGHLVLEVGADAPMDVVRLADAVRAYVDDRSMEVRLAPAAGVTTADAVTTPDLRATARALPGGEIELQVISASTGERLTVSLPRPARDADLYRTLALKVQSLLPPRPPEPPRPSPLLSAPVLLPPPNRTSVEACAHAVSYPVGGTLFAGAGIRGVLQLHDIDLGLQIAALLPVSTRHKGVDVSVRDLPVRLAASVRPFHTRAQASFGIVGELAWIQATPSSENTAVATRSFLIPSLGAEAAAYIVFVRGWSWFMRADLMAVLYGARLTVAGDELLDLSRMQMGVATGVAASWW